MARVPLAKLCRTQCAWPAGHLMKLDCILFQGANLHVVHSWPCMYCDRCCSVLYCRYCIWVGKLALCWGANLHLVIHIRSMLTSPRTLVTHWLKVSWVDFNVMNRQTRQSLISSSTCGLLCKAGSKADTVQLKSDVLNKCTIVTENEQNKWNNLHSKINTTYRFHSMERIGSTEDNVTLLRWQCTRAQFTFDSWASGSIINHVTLIKLGAKHRIRDTLRK